MNKQEAYNVLTSVVTTAEEMSALDVLMGAQGYTHPEPTHPPVLSQPAIEFQHISWKQYQFLKSMAMVSGKTLSEWVAERGIQSAPDRKWKLERTAGKQLLEDLVNMGMPEKLKEAQEEKKRREEMASEFI